MLPQTGTRRSRNRRMSAIARSRRLRTRLWFRHRPSDRPNALTAFLASVSRLERGRRQSPVGTAVPIEAYAIADANALLATEAGCWVFSPNPPCAWHADNPTTSKIIIDSLPMMLSLQIVPSLETWLSALDVRDTWAEEERCSSLGNYLPGVRYLFRGHVRRAAHCRKRRGPKVGMGRSKRCSKVTGVRVFRRRARYFLWQLFWGVFR